MAEDILGNTKLDDLQKAKLLEWLDYSAGATKFGNVSKKGIELSKNISSAIISRSGKLFDDLANKLGIDPNILKQYEIYQEVPLYTEGGFMIGDIILIKRNAITKNIEDVILIENKLSSGTDYTVRQKEGWKKLTNGESLVVKSNVTGIDGAGNEAILQVAESLSSSKVRPIRISDHGETNISNIDISDIPVENWKNYVYIPK